MSIYKGFSFFKYQYDKSIVTTDIQLVKTDLYNHIMTKRGTRVKMPLFGTTIPDMLFEPLTENLLFEMQTQLESVFNYDPRVTLKSLNLYPFYDRNAVYVVATLNYIELNLDGRFDINLQFQG